MRIPAPGLGALGAAFLALQGCQGATVASDETTRSTETLEVGLAIGNEEPFRLPIDSAGEFDSVWSYLVEHYDANADGRVSRDEYDRDRFDSLDRNGDGVIDGGDFESSSGGMAARMRAMMAQTMMALYLQDDDDADRLALAELERATGAYDADGDGRIARAEFEASMDSRKERGLEPSGMMARRMDDADPWETLAEGVDKDDDGTLDGEEIVSFFKEQDDGDLVWSLNRGRSGGRSAPSDETISGPPEGEWAPDFTIAPPEGGTPVTLSSFRGKKPVALIFGSYT